MRKLFFAFAVVLLASCAGKKSDVDVITNFYNAVLGQTEMTDELLKESVSEELLSTFWEADYEDTYSYWKLRTGYQDGLSEESSLESVEAVGDGWYHVAYTDMGIHAVTDVKMVKGKIADYKPFRIPFEIARGYFFRNGLEADDCPDRFFSQELLDQFFGMAAVMGENGKPTVIDFDKNFVIPVVYPETDQETSLVVERFWHTAPTELTLSVGAVRGEEHRSFTIRPVLLLIVDNYYRNYEIDLRLN